MATDKKAVSVVLDVEILDALDKECERQLRSRANLVGIYVRKALAELSEEDVGDGAGTTKTTRCGTASLRNSLSGKCDCGYTLNKYGACVTRPEEGEL